jgi:beta-N-acetylhexosaminidase
MKPVFFGLSGLALMATEMAFFREAAPAGYILFKRNIESRDQVRALTDSLRGLHGRNDLPILIDQEGGPVARLQPPMWPEFPGGPVFTALYDVSPLSAIQAARNNAEAIALILSDLGISVNCMPLLDVNAAQTHPAIGARTFGSDPVVVAALGRAVLDGLRAGGVTGVVKHMPGQGRAQADSHHALSVVNGTPAELERDLTPFHSLRNAPMAMTGHVIYAAWDAERPATLSPIIINDIIRTRIGFDGLLMSDDLEMEALTGSLPERAVACVKAGCDIALNCHSGVPDMVAIADALPDTGSVTQDRLMRAMLGTGHLGIGDQSRLAMVLSQRDALLAVAV